MKAGKGQVESYIKDISARLGMSKENFKKMMSNNSISYDLYKEEIEIDLMWQSLIFELNKNKIIIDESQIEQQLNNYLKNNNKIDEYELAEIVIERMIEIENQKKIIIEIQKYIDKFNFEEAAIKYSNSTSSANGGKIGWVNFNDLSDQLKNILINMSPGEISGPINNADQTIFIQLKNKRKINNLDMNTNKIKESLINKRKNELLNIFSNNHLSKKRNNTSIKILMSNEILIIAGDPNSINSEIIYKSYKKLNSSLKKRIYIIGSYNLIKKQFNVLKYKIKLKKLKT